MSRLMLVVATLGFGSIAAAAPTVNFEVRTPATGPHTLEVTVEQGPHLPAQRISVRVVDDPGAPIITAQRVRTFAEGGEPVAIAIVLNTQEIVVGNDDYETDEPARYPGLLRGLELGLDQLGLATLGPAGSQITVVGYSNGANVLVKLTPLATFNAAQIGSQHDFRNKIGEDLVAGITTGLTELERSDAPHKLLIVIGDGNDTNNEAARGELAELKQRARGDGVQLDAAIYKSPVSAEGDVISTMIPDAKTVNSIDGINAVIGARLHRITDRRLVTFEDDRLPWDGHEHDLALRLGDTELEPAIVRMPDFRAHASSWLRGKLAQLVIGISLLAILIAVMRLRERRA